MVSAARSSRTVLLRSLPSQHRLISNSTSAPRKVATASTSLHTPTRTFSPSAVSGQRYASSSSRKPPQKDSAEKDPEWSRHRTQYNYDPFTLHPEPKHYTYPLVTAADLSKRPSSTSGPGGRPREVRMLARDFIHDSLYNPNYGYFTKQAVLLPDPSPSGRGEGEKQLVGGEEYESEMGLLRPSAGFDFNSIKSESEFMRLVEERYQLFEEQISLLVADHQASTAAQSKSVSAERRERLEKRAKAPEYSAAGLEAAQLRGRALARRSQEGVQEGEVQSMAAKQVWHTPTQIFQPYYAHALARYLVAEYKLHNYPYDDLVIYELGAGSGALAQGILDYLAEREPEIYTRTRYRIVEISPRLAAEQAKKLGRHVEGGRVEVINKDILGWGEGVQEPCFVIALEVFDNLAHDVVRFGMEGLEPYQAVVSIDDTGDMHELFEPLSDPLIKEYLSIIGPSLTPLGGSWTRYLPDRLRASAARHAPFFPNLTAPLFVPTNALKLIQTLKTSFPNHRLIMSDFDSLPDSLVGTNAPVVQTRHGGAMVPVTTYLVLQGYFDIFFPTNFEHLKKMYRTVMGGREGRGDFFSSHFQRNLASDGGGLRRRERNLKVFSHAEFLERYAETEKLQLRDGSNPMLSWYQNASWFLS